MSLIKDSQAYLYSQSIIAIVMATLAILLSILILKAYNQNDEFEKSFREFQQKKSKDFTKIWVKDTIMSKYKSAEKNGMDLSFDKKQKKNNDYDEFRSLDNGASKLDLKQKISKSYVPRSLQCQQSVCSAYEYIRPRALEQEQNKEDNKSLMLMVTSIKL